jgi:hypothetical protein
VVHNIKGTFVFAALAIATVIAVAPAANAGYGQRPGMTSPMGFGQHPGMAGPMGFRQRPGMTAGPMGYGQRPVVAGGWSQNNQRPNFPAAGMPQWGQNNQRPNFPAAGMPQWGQNNQRPNSPAAGMPHWGQVASNAPNILPLPANQAPSRPPIGQATSTQPASTQQPSFGGMPSLSDVTNFVSTVGSVVGVLGALF